MRYLIIFFFTFQFAITNENSLTLKPILLDFNGIVGKDSTIIAYGNYGSYLVSYDGDKTWETHKAFDSGVIVQMFYENDRIVAFNRNGQVTVSYDNAQTWEIKENLDLFSNEIAPDLKFINIISAGDRYIIRKFSNLYLVNKDLKIVKIVNIQTPSYLFSYQLLTFNSKMLLFDEGKILVITDSSKVKILDLELNVVETIDLDEVYSCLDCYLDCQIFADDNNYYYQNGPNFIRVNKNWKNAKIINALQKDENKFLLIDFVYKNKLYFMSANGLQYFTLNKSDSIELSFEYDFSTSKARVYKDKHILNWNYNIINNKIYFVGTSNKIYKVDLSESKYPLTMVPISENSSQDLPFFDINSNLGKDNILAFNNAYGTLDIPISKLKLNSNLFNLVVNYRNQNNSYSNDKLNEYNNIVRTNYVDKTTGYVYIGSQYNFYPSKIFLSKDSGANYFEYKLDEYVSLNSSDVTLTKFDSSFYITYNNMDLNGGLKSIINVFSENFSLVSQYSINDEKFIKIYFKDSSEFCLLSNNTKSNLLSFKYTNDKGENWEVYKEYPNTTNLLESKELEINGKKIWAYTYYDFVTSQFNLDVIDVENKKVYNVFSSQLTQDQIDSIDYIGFDATKEKFYLTFYNTLMVSSNIFEDNIKWETFNYPNNGKVNKKFQIFDKTIFARYEDDKNEDNVYWINGIEMVGDPTSVEDIENIEEVNYLYTMPPYPNPTVSEVTAKFYWDSRIDIDNSDIAVFDITGNKVSGKENLTLEKLNEWSGNIKWNCVGQSKGTYLIKIQHGNNTKTVKVVVN